MAPIRLLIARIRTDQLPALLIIALVFATALVAAATPRLFNRVADDGLRYQVRQATVVERNLQDDAPPGGVPVPERRPVRDRGLDEGVVVRPAPCRRRLLAVEDLDREPLGHALTLGRSVVAVHGHPPGLSRRSQTRMEP